METALIILLCIALIIFVLGKVGLQWVRVVIEIGWLKFRKHLLKFQIWCLNFFLWIPKAINKKIYELYSKLPPESQQRLNERFGKRLTKTIAEFERDKQKK